MKRKPVPVEEKKPDTSKSVEVAQVFIERQRVREQKLFPLRIDPRTVIYVSRSKCNEAYRQEYIARQKATQYADARMQNAIHNMKETYSSKKRGKTA